MPGGWILRLITGLALAALWPAAAGAIPPLPDQPAAVMDGAGLLSAPSRLRMAERIEGLAAAGGRRLTVLTVESLGDRRLDAFTDGLQAHWDLRAPGPARLVLLVAWRERKVWLGEIGPGAGLAPDALQAVIDDVIVPAFHRRDFDRGVEAGLEALARLLTAEAGAAAHGALMSPLGDRLVAAGAGRATLAAVLLLLLRAATLLTRLAELRVEEPLAR